jgi:4-carboxymuconolactone decarboxylase
MLAPLEARRISVQGRLAPLDESTISTEHQIALAKVTTYFGIPPSGPFSVWVHQAGALEGAFQIFLAHRYEQDLERRLFELAVVIAARDWSADFPWTAHSAAAVKLGVAADVVEAIRLGKPPSFEKDDERAAYDLISELSRERKVAQETYDRAVAVLGVRRVVALVNAAGFYTMVSMATAAFEAPFVEKIGAPVRLPPLADMPTAAFDSAPRSAKARLAELDYGALTPAQRIEVAKVEAHFKQPPAGPFQIWAHQPGVLNGAFQLYVTHRYEGALDRRLMEIMTITLARNWGAQFVWAAHARMAAEFGVHPAAIEAIRAGETPQFDQEDERAVYEVTHEFCAQRKISNETFERAVSVLGVARLVALVNAMSFYTMICMGVVAFDMPVPEKPGLPAPLPSLAAH